MCFLRVERGRKIAIECYVFAMVHYNISTSRPCRRNIFCSFFSRLNTQCKQSQRNKVLKNCCVCPVVCVCGGGGGGGEGPAPNFRNYTGVL